MTTETTAHQDDGTPTTPQTAAAATEEGMLPLSGMTLLGTLTGGDPKALLRLSSGKIEMVETGARVRGFRIAAITEGEVLLARSNGKTERLAMPGA